MISDQMGFHILCPYSSSFLPMEPRSTKPRPKSGNGKVMMIEFPYVSKARRKMMVDLVSTVETRLDSLLSPCTLRRFQNQDGTSKASLYIRSGHADSQIDFILASWIHCDGGLDITSLSCYLNSETDAPNLVLDMIQTGPTSAVLLLDLKPRKDLVLFPEYLDTFYQKTPLETHRLALQSGAPEVKPYTTPSLHIRSALSPTAVMVRIEPHSAQRMDEIVRDLVCPVANEVLRLWLDECCCAARDLAEDEREWLRRRDRLAKAKTFEAELASTLPALFGPETGVQVLAALGHYFLA